jgi:hypothetical protein
VNLAQDSDLAQGSTSVTLDGHPIALANSNLSTSTGDEAGTAGGGLVSSKVRGKLTWTSSSIDVKIEGQGVVRFLDATLHNGNTSNTTGVTNGSASVSTGDTAQKPPCVHEWELLKPDQHKTIEEKRQRFLREALKARKKGSRSQARSYLFEAKAARHNQVKDGDCMSGPNTASKLFARCKKPKCKMLRELDHVACDSAGRRTAIVEAKSGNANIRKEQLDAQQEIASQLGLSLVYKIQKSTDAEKSAKALRDFGLPSANIILV